MHCNDNSELNPNPKHNLSTNPDRNIDMHVGSVAFMCLKNK